MQYLLLICGQPRPESALPESGPPESGPPAPADGGQAIDSWLKDVGERRLLGSELRPAASATTVRVRDGERLLSDGPFAETKEQILGFDLVECTNLDEALEIAATHPVAAFGSVEVRPLWV
jgi:hypothetical protein